MNRRKLSSLITHSLRKQGFRTSNGLIIPPQLSDKDQLRSLHAEAVRHKVEMAKGGLRRHEQRLIQRIAQGCEVFPDRIRPKLVEVKAGSEEELLFRYAALHWTIPVSSGYGRRLRFLVVDDYNDKLIGVIGLGDPVFNLAVRDRWVGWSSPARRSHLSNVMDAFILGAVPPYSALLCGKLVATLIAANEIRDAFHRKYHHVTSLISRRQGDGRLALVTTMSALGRSSIYNRLRFDGRVLFHSLGFSQGSGEFHFSNGLYGAIFDYTQRFCSPSAKTPLWGTGFRNRREVIRKCLSKIGLRSDLIYHGVRREVFAVPLAKNARHFLSGEHSRLLWYDNTVAELFAGFRSRWLLQRASWDTRYREFNRDSYQIWQGRK
jgi:hypothetical protein